MDLREFAAKMRRRSKDLPVNVNKVKQTVAAAILTSLANDTPVARGTAISNWQVGLNKGDFAVIDAYVPGLNGSTQSENIRATISAGATILAGSRYGQVIHIGNPVPYIGMLNEGWSAQAPRAFIETAIKRGLENVKSAKVIKE